MLNSIVGRVVGAHNDDASFRSKLAAMPETMRQEAVQQRLAALKEEKRRQEHEALVEASKPHTLWSFLGLGRK